VPLSDRWNEEMEWHSGLQFLIDDQLVHTPTDRMNKKAVLYCTTGSDAMKSCWL
jgi:hypothetical protein